MAGQAPAVDLAVDILELLATNRERAWTITEIARELGANKPTCHTVALRLVNRGFLVRDETSKTYSLGPALVRLGALGNGPQDYLRAALRELRPLADSLALCCVVSVLLPNDLVMVAGKVDSPRTFHSTVRVGEVFTPPTVSSEVLFAWRSPSEGARSFSGRRRLEGGDRIEASLAEYLDQLSAVRAAGFSIGRNARPESPEGRRRGAPMIISAPVFDAFGGVPLAVSTFGLPTELDETRLPEYVEAVVIAASAITRAIGGNDTARPPLDRARLAQPSVPSQVG
jgi:DNA-binding IclR family transcriptional regulator